MVPVREVTRSISQKAVLGKQKGQDSKSKSQAGIKKEKMKIRPVSESDFKEAMTKVKRTGEAAQSFRQRESRSMESAGGNSVNLAQAMQMMNLMLSSAQNNADSHEDEDDEEKVPSIN